jgi:hypothetical protein
MNSSPSVPMMTVKVQCDCGQRYAFDVEPGTSSLNTAVACPACGADGTAAANQFIAQQAAQAPAPRASAPIRIGAPPAQAALRVASPAHSAAAAPVAVAPSSAPQAGLRVAAVAETPESTPTAPGHRHVDRTRAENEARAKIMWGDDPKKVASFLRSEGLSFEEANSMVQELFVERAKTVRAEGFKKMIIGGALVLVPIVFFLACLAAGRIPVRILALTVMAGFYGLWQFVKGLLMFLAPKSESGDIYDS